MLTWMQKHKKYLVITIWISTIAFVGAGFVGWGAYDFNASRAKSVANIAGRDISIAQYQRMYGELFEYYSQVLGGEFSQEKADEIGLKSVALSRVIEDGLILRFADELGLAVSDEELAVAVASEQAFYDNGKFDKARYEQVLRQMRVSAVEFEEGLRDKLLLKKLFSALSLPISPADTDMMAASYFLEDGVQIAVISVDKSGINASNDEIKAAWEPNKEQYKTKLRFELETRFLEPKKFEASEEQLRELWSENRSDFRDGFDKLLEFDAAKDAVKEAFDKKSLKKEALEQYLKLKKGELNAISVATVSEDDDSWPISELKGSAVGEVLKPFEYNGGFMIARVKNRVSPEIMSYEQAKGLVEKVVLANKYKEALNAQARAALKDFEGADVGFISRAEIPHIDGLSDGESAIFAAELFKRGDKKGFIELSNQKAVLYKITSQRLFNEDKKAQNSELLAQSVSNLKNDQLIQDLLKSLRQRYKITQYYKGE